MSDKVARSENHSWPISSPTVARALRAMVELRLDRRLRRRISPSDVIFPVEVVQFGRGKNLFRGVSFPLRRFGSYAVALEMDRP